MIINRIKQSHERFREELKIYKSGCSKQEALCHEVRWAVNKVLFGASAMDYFKYSLYNKPFFQRFEYIYSNWYGKFVYTLNSPDAIEEWSDKVKMYKQVSPFLKRDQLYTEEATFEEFRQFVQRHPIFIIKPANGWGGHGIRRIEADMEHLHTQYESLKSSAYICDELIEQNEYMSKINDKTVNTVRIVTIRFKEDIEFVAAALRFGVGDTVADNFSSGGGACTLDIHTGKTVDLAENMYGERFRCHPISNVDLTKIEIPLWKQVIDLVKETAKAYPLNYAAWDVAVRENDTVLVEANPFSGLIIQSAGAGGRKKQYKQYLKRWRKEHK